MADKSLIVKFGADTVAFKKELNNMTKNVDRSFGKTSDTVIKNLKDIEGQTQKTTKSIESDFKNINFNFDKKTKEAMKELDKVKQKTEEIEKKGGTSFQRLGNKIKGAIGGAKSAIAKDFDRMQKDAENSTDDMKQNFESIGNTVKKIGGIVAGAFVIGGISSFIDETVEMEKDLSKLHSTFQSLGSDSKTAQKTFDQFYSFMGETDTAVEASQLLANMTTNQKDLSSWTNIATGVYARFGDSLPIEGMIESANETAEVGKVTGSLADALNWAGINEDEFNKKLEKTTSFSEREKLIRETLNKEYEKSAEVYKKNNAELMAYNEAQSKWQTTLQEVGKALLPAKTELMNFGTKVLGKINFDKVADRIKIFGDAIGDFAKYVSDSLDNFVAGFKGAGEVDVSFTDTIKKAFEKLRDAIASIDWKKVGEAIRGVFDYLVKHGDTIIAVVSGIGGAFVTWKALTTITTTCAKLIPKIKKAYEAVKLFFLAWKNWGFLSVAKGLLATIGSPITIIIGVIAALVGIFVILWTKVEGFRNFWKNLWKKIKDFCVPIIQTISDTLKGTFSEAVEGVKGTFQGLWDSLKTIWQSIVDVLDATGILNVFKLIAGAIGGALAGVIGVTTGVINGILNAIKPLAQMFENIVQVVAGAFEFIAGIFTLDGEKIKAGFQKMWDGLVGILQNAKDLVWGLLQGFWEGFSGFFGKLFEQLGIDELWNKFTTWFTEKKDAFVGWFNDWFEPLTGWFSEKTEPLKEKLGEWKDGIGGWFSEKKDTLTEGFSSWWEGMPQWFEEKKTSITDGFNTFKEEAGKCMEDPDYLINKINGWTEGLNTWSLEKLEEIKEDLVGWKDGISAWFTEKATTFADGFGAWWTNVTTWFTERPEKIKEKLGEWKESISTWFTEKKDAFKEGFTTWWTNLTEWFTTSKDEFPAKLDKWKTAISDWFTEKKNTITDGFKEWIKGFGDWNKKEGKEEVKKEGGKTAENIGEGIKEKTKEKGFILKIGNAIWKLFLAAIGAVLVGIVAVGWSLISFIWQGIKKAWGWLKENFIPLLKQLGEWCAKKWEEIKRKTAELWGKVKDAIMNKVNDVKKKAVDKFTEMKNGIVDKINKLKDGAKSAMKSMANKGFINPLNTLIHNFKKGINKIISAVNWVSDKVAGKKLIDPISNPKQPITPLAKGTNNWKGGTALVGEAGRELVSDPKVGTFMADSPMLLNLSKGASVLRNSKTEKLLSNFGIPAFAKGKKENIFTKGLNKAKEWGAGAVSKVKSVGSKVKETISTGLETLKSGAKDVFEYVKNPSKLLELAFGDATFDNVGIFGDIVSSMKTKIIDKIKGKIGKLLEENDVARWTHNDNPLGWKVAKGWAERGLTKAGIKEGSKKWKEFMTALEIVGRHESNYNNNRTNNWDINAKNGTPSSGWLQFIQPTFKSHNPKGEWKNAVDQVVAFVSYANKRYGGALKVPGVKSVLAGGKYKPYANGGLIQSPTMALMGEAGTEAVVPLSNAKALKPFGNSVANSIFDKTKQKVETHSNNDVTYEFTIPVIVDGREIAKATASFTKEELDKLEKRDNRRNGKR